MANEILPGFHFYQSANAQAALVKANFLVRVHEFDVIMDDIRRQPAKGSVQHFLIIGRRGSGKSTLLKRIQVELESDSVLTQKFIGVNLAEEQANIYKLYDLLEAVLEEMDYHGLEVDVPAPANDATDYARELFAAIHKALKASKKKMVLLLDNIDRIFENIQEDASLLREYLLNYNDIKIIGGSTKMTEHFWKYNKPFYEFFRVLELKPLGSEEIKRLLINWSEKLKLPELAEFVKNKPGQLETIRILTDGLPRTLQFFVNILLTRSQETGYEYLNLIMDKVSPLYQERLNSLPPSQRKIVLQLAFLWEGVGAGELAAATKMDAKLISAQLKQLIEKGIADKIATSTKNHLYRLSERFFNLWLIFTQGSPKEKRKARCLTVFLENFYDAEEIVRLAGEHLETLKAGSSTANKAALLTKALAQSRHISFYLRDELIRNTMELKNMADELRRQLPPTTTQISNDIETAISRKDFNKAIQIADTIEQEDGYREFLIGYVHGIKKNYTEAKNWLQKSYEIGFTKSIILLAKAYRNLGEEKEVENCLFKAIELGYYEAYYWLGVLSEEQGKDEEAVKYYQQALDNEQWEAAYKLGTYYITTDPKLAESYLEIGVQYEIEQSARNLAVLYFVQNINQDRAFELLALERSWSTEENIDIDFCEVLFGLWKGDVQNLESRSIELVSKRQWEDVNPFITWLLIFEQTNLVNRLFSNPEFGADLKDDFLPLYYATIALTASHNDNELKVPPELKDTVNKIIIAVGLKRFQYKS